MIYQIRRAYWPFISFLLPFVRLFIFQIEMRCMRFQLIFRLIFLLNFILNDLIWYELDLYLGVDIRRMHWNELSGSDWLINIVDQSTIIQMYLCAVQKSIDNKSSSQNQYQFIYFRCFFSIILNKLDFDPKYFWAWTDFQSYLDFMLAIWFVGAIITYFMLPFTYFMESVGFMAVFIEAMLGKRIWLIANGNHFLHRTKMTMFFFYSI